MSLPQPHDVCALTDLAPGMRVGDFGCGAHGALAHHLAHQVGEQGQVYALDVQPHVLQLVGRGHSLSVPPAHIETVWSDMEQYGAASIPHGSLDRIFLVDVVSSLDDITAALRECDRLLRPGGHIVLVDWGNQNHPLAPNELISPEHIKHAAENVFLQSSELAPVARHHWGIILKRA